MKKLSRKIEATLSAAAFAEEGEVAMARRIMIRSGEGDAGDPISPGRQRAPQPRSARAGDAVRSSRYR